MKRTPQLPLLPIILFLLLSAAQSATLCAQEGLKINDIFEKYGRKKGATMVSLSGKPLRDYRLDKYRSITLRYDSVVMDDLQKCLEGDRKQAASIKEVVSNGIIISGYYRLPVVQTDLRRYILFKVGDDGTATLIYMEGGPESEELIGQIFIHPDSSTTK